MPKKRPPQVAGDSEVCRGSILRVFFFISDVRRALNAQMRWCGILDWSSNQGRNAVFTFLRSLDFSYHVPEVVTNALNRSRSSLCQLSYRRDCPRSSDTSSSSGPPLRSLLAESYCVTVQDVVSRVVSLEEMGKPSGSGIPMIPAFSCFCCFLG